MKDTLLKDAIADAKTVKEVAIQNAMLTLQESFKPQISSMLAAKLRNESDDFDADDETVDEQTTLDSSDIAGSSVTVKEPAPKQPSKNASDSSDIENKGLEVDTFGEGFDMGGEDDQFGGEPSAPAAPDAFGGDAAGGMDDMGGEGQVDDLDLESIIRELEADLMGGGEDEMGMDPVQQGAPAPAPAMQQETLAGKEGEGSLKSAPDRASVEGVPLGKKVTPGQSVTDPHGGDGMTEDVDLEEILREMEAEDAASMEESEKIATENVELKRNLREHREVIKLLRNRINEVNMLNNKLMFTTKIFRNFELDEATKKKVVEQFDRANTLREAKLVFSTLAESLTGKVRTSSTKKTAGKMNESASKPMGSTKSKSQTVLNEGDDLVARFQRLANIKHN